MTRWHLPILATLVLAAHPAFGQRAGDGTADGRLHAGDPGRTGWSPAAQITPKNVWRLQRAWTYESAARSPSGSGPADSYPAAPILLPAAAGGSLVLCEPADRVVALDPANGRLRWSHVAADADAKPARDCPGVSYWRDPSAAEDAACAHRLFAVTGDGRLIALDARDGQPCRTFGSDGEAGTAAETGSAAVLFRAPPIVVDGVVAFGHGEGRNGDDSHSGDREGEGTAGALRAVDARSGELLWSFDPRAQGGGDTWHAPVVDEARKLVFVPTSGASPAGFDGPADRRLASSVIALRAATGAMAWQFQTVHHDVWNSDAAALVLADVPINGRRMPAVVAVTAQSLVFVLDRETGAPLLPVEERAVPVGDDHGESLSATQPFPVKPPPLARMELGPDDAWGMTFWDEAQCRRFIMDSLHGGPFVPTGGQAAITYPAATGAGRRGIAYDPVRNLLVATVAQLASHTRSVPDADPPALERRLFLGQTNLPCTPPPWSTLVGVDLQAGEIRWSVPLGTFEPMAVMGNLLNRVGGRISGGPIITAGGLVFAAATADQRLRAHDLETGKQHWSTSLPAPAYATPLTYEVHGSQYVVIAAEGRTTTGDGTGAWLFAYALPDRQGGMTTDDEP